MPARHSFGKLLEDVDCIRLRQIRILANDEVADAARLRERRAELYDPTVAGSICRWDHSSRDGER